MKKIHQIIFVLTSVFLFLGLKNYAQQDTMYIYNYGHYPSTKYSVDDIERIEFSENIPRNIKITFKPGAPYTSSTIFKFDSIIFYNPLPEVITQNVSDVTDYSATLNGNITFAGSPEYVYRGFCFSNSPNPDWWDDRIDVAGNGTGEYAVNISELMPNTTYYVRAFTETLFGNQIEIKYGIEINFTTLPEQPFTCYGNVTLSTESEVLAFKNAGCKYLKGNLWISGNTLQTLTLLDNQLKEISGDLTLNASNLTTLDGLYGLEKISGSFRIYSGKMITFEGCNNLLFIGKDFSTSSSSNPYNFTGLAKLEFIGGNFYINNSFSSFTGLEKLSFVGGNFQVSNDKITSFTKLESLKSINGNFEISNTKNTSFAGLEKIQTIGGNFKIRNLNSLTSFSGLENVEFIGGNLEITASYTDMNPNSNSMNSLTSFSGLESLQAIGGDFIITAYANGSSKTLNSLISFSGLENLQSIGGRFEINATAKNTSNSSYNAYSYALNSLTSFTGLESLQSIGASFIINAAINKPTNTSITNKNNYLYTMNSLSSFMGLENLKFIGGNFEIISYVGYTYYSTQTHSLSSLASFSGLNSLQSIGGNIKISDDWYDSLYLLTSFSGLNSLTSIGGIDLYDMPFVSLTGLANVNSIMQDVYIKKCPNLFNFCPLVPAIENMTGTWYVNGCGYNPTKYQMLNGQCSQ